MSDLLQLQVEVYWKSYERYYKGRITTYKKRTDEHCCGTLTHEISNNLTQQ